MNKRTTFKINGKSIRAVYDQEMKIRIDLSDLCKILKSEELMRNGDAVKLCPTSIKIVFRPNGKETWGIKPIDVHNLLNTARKVTTLPHSFIKEIERWANRLIESERPMVHKSEPIVFNYKEGFPVTFQIVGDRIMVNTTQITKQFDKLPSEWLRIAATDAMRHEMEENSITGTYDNQIFTTRGRGNGATWLEGPLAVELCNWIAPQSGLADWCEEYIRKLEIQGVPMSAPKHQVVVQVTQPPLLDEPLPDNLEDALLLIQKLKSKIEEDAPKLAFYEEFIENRDSFKSTRIADELNISPHQLHRFLFEEGICKYENRRWVVLPLYRTWQCDIPYAWTSSLGKTYIFGSSKRWTQFGRESIIDLWKQKHPES